MLMRLQIGRSLLELMRVQQEDQLLDPEEKERLKQENEALKDDMSKVKEEMKEAAKLCLAPEQEDEEEEDDEDDEPPPDFFKSADRPAGPRASVSAEAYGEWNTKKAFVAPVILKSEEQKARLTTCLSKSFLFSALEEQDLLIVVGAMKEVNAEPKQRLINQGDSGDFLFVVESGRLDCSIKADGTDKIVKTCEAGDVFGELALLYNCPRAASVEATTACVLWQLDRDTFNNIVKEAAQKKRDRYNAFLSSMQLFSSMDAYERSQLADALKSEEHEDGAVILKQGDPGHAFYMVEEGSAVASKDGKEVMSYSSGDYFGELAILRNQPRAASIIAKGKVKLLSLESRSFKRLVNISDLLNRSSKYT